MELPSGYEAQIRPHSRLAPKHHITVTNSPGTVDANFRGEVTVILYNLSREPFVIQRGDRIAQMVICELTEIVDCSKVIAKSGKLRNSPTIPFIMHQVAKVNRRAMPVPIPAKLGTKSRFWA